MPPALQPQTATPMEVYERCVREGKLKDDEAQLQVIARLQKLYQSLTQFHNATPLGKLLRLQRKPRSVYIWGEVGRGKSLLMDMLYGSIESHYTRRIHFQEFMQEVHTMLHVWRRKFETPPSIWDRLFSPYWGRDLIQTVSLDIASDYGFLLCLDELQVTDVADAMILSKLFASLLDDGVTFVITSNRPPEALYQGGLQRESFLSFIDLVYARMDVLELTSPNDYRMQQIRSMQTVYMQPLSDAATTALEESFRQLTHHATLHPVTLDIQGRKLAVAESYGGVARFTFEELCAKPLGAADYLAIASRFHTVFISNIPQMGPEKRNESRRFVTLIDMLYDHKVKLICTAAATPENLYPAGDGTFEFARTVSRLAEMQSEAYLATAHIP